MFGFDAQPPDYLRAAANHSIFPPFDPEALSCPSLEMRSSISFALVAVLAVFASSVSALPSNGALKARSPAPSPAVRRAPAPSAPSKRHDARAPAPSGARRSLREQEPILPADISSQLCPSPMHVCPLPGTSVTPASLEAWTEFGFECVDFSADLDSCGGCGSVDSQ